MKAEEDLAIAYNSRVESLDYDEAEHNFIAGRSELSPAGRKAVGIRLAALTIALMVIVGVVVGSIAYSITWLVSTLSTWKWSLTDPHWHNGDLVAAWLYLMGAVTALGLPAALLTLWAPKALGSGIPHVKSYLNGNKLLGVLKFKTLVAKVIGISCCVAVGLPVGREVRDHSSGSGTAQLPTHTCFLSHTSPSPLLCKLGLPSK